MTPIIPQSLDEFSAEELMEAGEWLQENAESAGDELEGVLQRLALFLYAEGEER